MKKHHRKAKSGWDRVLTKNLDLRKYRNERGFEQIASDLDIEYPDRPRPKPHRISTGSDRRNVLIRRRKTAK